ncbi:MULTISPECIES: hypothetical protein [unclassified Nocardiopsis]|uniref:hypothetical protein n=1 Tax=unclassified Nocardiopsis TaxID=2649073 RepID=UPI001F5C0A66|nr:hypothetical protein [Nocardiopsis sp. TSRI0078]
MSTLVVLVCLAVVASGWGVARLTVGGSLRPLGAAEAPASPHPRDVSAGADPEDAGAYVEAAAELVEGSPAFHITFRVYDGGSAPRDGGEAPVPGAGDPPADDAPTGTGPYTAGLGEAVYASGAEPEFDHTFTTEGGRSVYRYDMGGGQLMMTADRGLELLDPPSTADRYLCSPGFGAAKLREVLDTSTDLALTGLEEVRLERPGLRSTHSAYRYTGTFTAVLGGYDPEAGSNTLTTVEDAEFELWIDEGGYPRRLDYRAADGVGESYEYHSFS